MSSQDLVPQDARQESVATVKPSTYVVRYDLPDRPTVRLVFEGLLWFVFHHTDECQIGIHNTTQGPNPHGHPHDLDIRVWSIDRRGAPYGCKMERRFHIGDPQSITGIQIDVNRPTIPGVYCYERNYGGSRQRITHENDWHWVIDFEKAPLYPTGIRLHDPKVNPGISINHGIFYTIYKTSYKFEFVPDDGTVPKPADYVALLAGGNIYMDSGSDLTLVIRRAFPAQPVIRKLEWKRDTTYQIDIRNICMIDSKRCPRERRATTDPHVPNDFDLYNDTFTRPLDEPLYTLRRIDSPRETDLFSTLPPYLCDDPNDPYDKRSNNEAPCGPVCAGGGGGG